MWNNRKIVSMGCLLLAYLLLQSHGLLAQETLALTKMSNDHFEAEFNQKGLTVLKRTKSTAAPNVVRRANVWGRVNVLYQMREDGDWINHYDWSDSLRKETDTRLVYTDYQEGVPLKVERIFEAVGNGLDLTIRLESMRAFPVSIGQLALPLEWARPSGENPEFIFEQSFIKHQYIGGNGSYLYFTKPNGKGPYLLLMAKPGTRLEYFDNEQGRYRLFVHAEHELEAIKQGNWRLEATKTMLAPVGMEGSMKTYGFRMQWAESYEEMRDILVQNGLIDVRVIPGMTVPQGMKARVALRMQGTIDAIIPEFPESTEIKSLPTTKAGYRLYEVAFTKLGENKLSLRYNGGQQQILEFFATEPIRTLIEKRTAFITTKQQHRDSTKWYNGLYSIWDMREQVLRGPDNTDGFDFWWGYVLTADDPALCKAPFVAAKNVYQPNSDEIASLEYYVKHFVWGGLQRNDGETNPYGVHGVPNWHEARDSSLRLRSRDYNLHKMKIWRSYDYPHIFMLYYHLFQIAEFYPEMVHYLTAEGYLERAYQTAQAYFKYPYEINPWYETYKWGCYNELVLVPLIADLERYGRQQEADHLRQEWEKKVKYFVYDDPYPFRSEYSIDRTAFESSYAFAKYGSKVAMKADSNLWYDVNKRKWYSHPKVSAQDSRAFMDRQHWAGLAVRGWLTPAYYALGSDDSESGGLSYMARMGGWSILDYGLHFADEPWDWLQLGYASYLSSFALFNTGNENSNYGYWFPGKENDGAMGWAFNTQKFGRIWLQDRRIPRGPWNYDGEADLGNGAIARMACTLIAEDPIFGWTAYGGNLEEKNKSSLTVIPQDGMNIRFGLIRKNQKLLVELSRDRLAINQPIVTDKQLKDVVFHLENMTSAKHPLSLKFTGSPGTTYQLKMNGKLQGSIAFTRTDGEVNHVLELPEKGAKMELLRL